MDRFKENIRGNQNQFFFFPPPPPIFKFFLDKLFYIGLSISSGVFFSYLLKRLEARKKKQNGNENEQKFPLDHQLHRSSFSGQASINMNKIIKFDSSDPAGVMTPG